MKQRICFKILLKTCKAINDSGRAYLSELVQPYTDPVASLGVLWRQRVLCLCTQTVERTSDAY